MNTKLIVSLSVIAGIMFAGCEAKSAVTKNQPTMKPSMEAVDSSIQPTMKPSTAVKRSEESEVDSIEAEFENIDASKDFPDFTQTDLQQ